MELGPYMKSRMLTRCTTVNERGEERARFIEAENYRLWEYLVTNKHGMRIVDEIPCLWLPAGEFARYASVYEHSGEIEPVNRIVIAVFDEALVYTSVIERFTHRAEVFTLLNILNNHLADGRIDEESIESAVIPGYTVEKRAKVAPETRAGARPGI